MISTVTVILSQGSGCHLSGCRSSPAFLYGYSIKASHLGTCSGQCRCHLSPLWFPLVELPERNLNSPFRAKTSAFLVWQTWVSTTPDLTLKKKPPHYATRHAHTIRPLSLKEKHNFPQSSSQKPRELPSKPEHKHEAVSRLRSQPRWTGGGGRSSRDPRHFSL